MISHHPIDTIICFNNWKCQTPLFKKQLFTQNSGWNGTSTCLCYLLSLSLENLLHNLILRESNLWDWEKGKVLMLYREIRIDMKEVVRGTRQDKRWRRRIMGCHKKGLKGWERERGRCCKGRPWVLCVLDRTRIR